MFTKRKLIKQIERKMIEEELDIHFLESQSERAYRTGVLDGLSDALYMISPKRARRNPLAMVWYTEDEPTQTLERQRERAFEIMHVDMEDPAPVACYAGLFETEEAP